MNFTEMMLILTGALGLLVFFRWFLAGGNARSTGMDARRQRIRNASLVAQCLLGGFFLMGSYWVVAFLCGWPFGGQDHVRIVVSHNHIYTAPGEMPGVVLGWWLVQVSTGLVACGVLFALFRLYFKGILFSAANTLCIRLLGYALILGSVADYQMQNYVGDMAWSTTPVFIGLLIIFISWIMDEGRKIQEEQELTV